MWCLATVVRFSAAMAFIVSHVYEDWKVNPVLDPASVQEIPLINSDAIVAASLDPTVYTNERLRHVSYRLFLTVISISSLMYFHAYQGWSQSLTLSLLAISRGLFAYTCIGDKHNLVSHYLSPLFDNNIN